MGRRLVIDPVTRIEGHAKITLQLDEAGEVADARLHVTELRGFEKLCEGRSFRELPVLTARVCGICPVSHSLASSLAGDAILAVEVPEAATLLRSVVNLAQLVQSHALSLFHLSGPDLFLGVGSDAARRGIAGLADAHPDLARDGVRLRRFGQEAIEAIAGRRVHPEWTVPGGVLRPLSREARDRVLGELPEAVAIATRTARCWRRTAQAHREEARRLGSFESLFLGMVADDGTLEHTAGRLRLVDARGERVAEVEPARWREVVGEAVEPDSYLKFPYYRPLGYPAGMYRVGPLARLNVASRCGTPLADEELAELRAGEDRPLLSPFHAHHARLVEILYALERMEVLLLDPLALSRDVRAIAARNRARGVGACEAPRGTLFHEYEVDRDGVVTRADLVVATGQNALAMNRTLLEIARAGVSRGAIPAGLPSRLEAGIRAFDPCLSCSTHAAGKMPLSVELRAPDGALLDRVERSP